MPVTTTRFNLQINLQFQRLRRREFGYAGWFPSSLSVRSPLRRLCRMTDPLSRRRQRDGRVRISSLGGTAGLDVRNSLKRACGRRAISACAGCRQFRQRRLPGARQSRRFGEVDNASVQSVISLQVELVDTKPTATFGITSRAPGTGQQQDCRDVVQSLDRNLQRVVSDAAAEIDKFLETRR